MGGTAFVLGATGQISRAAVQRRLAVAGSADPGQAVDGYR